MSLTGRPQAWQVLHKKGIAVTVVALLTVVGSVYARAPAPASPPVSSVAWADLPREAQQTEHLVRAGGPFRDAKDGIVFGNRERMLPSRPRGFYREYTVRTPGVRDRGARRIVCGGSEPARPEACYYTADHYASFRRIVD